MKMDGGCQCGRVRFSAEIASDDAFLCHCRMCQRASGNVSIAFATLAKADVMWITEPDWYASSERARRPFCGTCGTPLGFAYHAGDTMDLHVATFDEPSNFVPRRHFGVSERLENWRNTAHLPDHVPVE
ncbi:MAG: GFA family protein [Pseudomonadota bacterium]